MKKVKTILASLMIILATAVLSACSCSNDNDGDEGPQIPVSTITITSDFAKATRDEETGYLLIRCSRNDEFDITYTLGPDNTTRTQVDWDFEGNDSVVVVRKNYYSYSQSITHTVGFRASKVGNTIIKFKPKNTDKWTQATVIVGEAETVWPSFVAPSGLDYNPVTGKVTWNPVSQMKLHTGDIVNVSMSNGIVSGLTGYIISYTNLTTGETYTTPHEQPFSACEYQLPRGNTYEVKVLARGDDFTTKDSPYSLSLKFHQLATAQNLKNNNGEITFDSPEYSESNEVYYNALDRSKFVTRASDGATKCTLIASENFASIENYSVYVVSYPRNFAQAKVDGKAYAYDESTKTRFYPSIQSDSLYIENLISPTITISPVRGFVDVAGITFGTEGSNNNPFLSSMLKWEIASKTYNDDYQVKYAYTISKNVGGNTWVKIYPSVDEFAVGTSFDLSQLTATNEQHKLTVYAFGNPANTIASSVTEIFFNVLSPMDREETSITTTTLTTSTASSALYGVELFFINKNNASDSVYKFYDGKRYNGGYDQKQLTISISDLNLVPGTYDIYGRFVGINSGASNLSATSQLIKINTRDVIVASPVANNSISMTSAGILTFEKVNSIDNYILSIGHTSDTDTDNWATQIVSDSSNTTIVDSKNKVSVNIYDLIKNHLMETGIDSESLEDAFANYTSNSTITITITSVGIDGQGINSAPSNTIKFRRHNLIDASTINLNYNELSFISTNDSATYVVSIGGKEYITPSYNNGEVVSVDLSTAIVGGEANKTLIDYVNSTSSTDIKVWAMGNRSQANGNLGFVDGYATTKTFKCTEFVTGLEVDKLGNLKWDLSSAFSDEQSFDLKFYTKDSNDWNLINDGTIRVSASREVIGGEEEGAEVTIGKYTFDILSKIREIGANKTIAITVTHRMSDRFANVESDKYYVIQLSDVPMEKIDYDNDPAIKFNTLTSTASIEYLLKVINLADNSVITQVTIKDDEANSVIKKLNELNINTAGNYSITLSASKNTIGDNSEDNAYILSSTETSVDVVMLSRQIGVVANEEYVTWSSLHPNATYTLEYKTPSAGDYKFITDGETNKLFTSEELQYNVWQLFEAGINEVRITPYINYTQTGVVLVGTIKVNNIVKLQTVASVTAESGVLKYTLSETFENNEYNVLIKVKGIDDAENTLLAGEYTIDYTNQTISVLSTKYVGEYSYYLKVVANNKITSDYSAPYNAIKIATVSDLSKDGNYLNFTHIDGANIYELIFENVDGSNKSIKRIKYDSSKIYIELTNEENASDWQEIVDASIAKFENGKIYLKFDNELLGIDMTNAGIYYYSITSKTDINGKLNGNTSNKYTLAKLSNNVNISVNNDSIVLSDYVRGDSELETPVSIDYSINYSQDISNRIEKNTTWTDVTWNFDGSRFDANSVVDYTLSFVKLNESDGTKADTFIRLNSADGTITVADFDEENNLKYKVVDYVSATATSNGYTITYKASNIIGTELTTALGGEPDYVVISYTESKQVNNGTLNYSSINIEGASEETGTSNSYAISLNSLGLLDSGNYQLKLQFIGNGNEVISSEIVTSEVYNKLEASSLFTSNGVISWNAVDNANSYTLFITTDPISEEEITSWTFENYSVNASAEEGIVPSISEIDLMGLNPEFVGFETGRIYNIQIMSNGSGKLSSAYSQVFQVQKLQAPTNITISSTGNTIERTDQDGNVIETIKIGEPMVTWTDPNNMSSRPDYTLTIGDMDEIFIHNTSSSGSSLLGQLLSSNIPVGNYEISMKVIGNTTTGTNKMGLLTSDPSIQNPFVNYVPETQVVGFANNTFTWDAVPGAYTYKLTFYKGMFNTSDLFATADKVYTTFTTTNSYNFTSSEFDGYGYFTVLINAICDPAKAVVSSYIEPDGEGNIPVVQYTNCASIYKSSGVSQLMVKDGLLSWSLKISDIKEFLSVHADIENDTLYTYFSITDTDKNTAQEKLLTSVYDYISNKINNGAEGDAGVDRILSNLYTFKATINGIETYLKPTVVDAITIGAKNGKPDYVVTAPTNAEYLMYKYDLTTVPVKDENDNEIEESTEQTSTTKFVIKVTPRGNNESGNDTGLISSVDGKYLTTITVYKPKTPKSVNIDTDTEGLTRKQISNGNLYWSLVTTEDSTTTSFDYHKNYKITAINQNATDNRLDRKINIDSTIVDGVNPNLKDKSNYYRYLKDKDLFGTVDIATNTNYTLQISVMGTEDSTLLGANDKIYLNSNIFNYTDVMNILANHGSTVSSGEYSYTPCTSMSSETDVYVYGPFADDRGKLIYAPDANDRSTWVWNVTVDGEEKNYDYSNESSGKTYEDAVKTWKELISYSWNTARANEWIGNLRHVYTFTEEVVGEGEGASTSRQTTLNLTGKLINETDKFGAGSYIFRKQEIGNGRGIIDTDISDILIDAEGKIPSFDYEQIATKLDIATKSEVINPIDNQPTENSIWLENGRFVWKKVDRANAYRVSVQKINNVTGETAGDYSDIVLSTSLTNNEYFDMPENVNFNTPSADGVSYVYKITIIATHLENDGKTISPFYFEGEDITTDGYGRAPIPANLNINEEGVISWNNNVSYSSISGYEVRINQNSENPEFVNKEQISDNSYDLSKVDYGTFDFSIRSLGVMSDGSSFINSCYTPTITITKLANPVINVINGQVNWGTETSEGFGEQPTKTNFKLKDYVDTTLDETEGKYILHSEINSFDSTYALADEIYKTGEYTFGVKYQGTYGNVDDNNRQFTIASGEQILVAQKLGSPTLSSVDVISGESAENRIRWEAVENASGYRALVITQVNEGDRIINKIFDIMETCRVVDGNYNYSANILIKNDDEVISSIDATSPLSKDYFAYNAINNTVELRLSKVIETLNLSSDNGISLNVYVQPVGTLNSTELGKDDTIYISGSFSDKKNVEIPAKPTGINFDGSTGTLAWNVADPNKGHNAKITMTYEVPDVSEDEFNGYWKNTSDSIQDEDNASDAIKNENIVGRYSEIRSRHITYKKKIVTVDDVEITTYTIHVTDVVFLEAVDRMTPTSYQVTNIGTKYNFSVRVMVGDENYDGIYMSDQAELTSKDTVISFALFSFGDGSEARPYGVKDNTMFNSIRYYSNSHFVITDNITFKDESSNTIRTWNVIDTFSGSIDGGNYTVSFINPDVIRENSGSDILIYKAFIRENNGTISNLNMSVNSVLTGTYSNSKASVSGFVITNNGTLNNVHITTYNLNSTKGNIAVELNGTLYNSRVAGLAVENTGTIDGCSVDTENNLGIYAIDSNADNLRKSTYAAGLVNVNTGTINNSYFSGTITGNFVGGIANENAGTISNSYTLGTANITDIGLGSVTGKGIQYGGIAGSVYGNANIINCYSRIEVVVDIKTTSDIALTMGGIFAQVASKTTDMGTVIANDITISNCYVVFSAINIGKTGNVNITANVVAPYNNKVTYSNNYYVVVLVENTDNNINATNSENVATNAISIDNLATTISNLKDSNGKAIYVLPTTTIIEEEKISKYPLLASNLEKNIIYKD